MAQNNSNPYEALAREEKTTAIVDILDGAGHSSRTVTGFDLEQWQLAYAAARQIWRDSPETRDLVIKKLRLREVAMRTAKAIIRDSEIGVKLGELS